MITHIGRQAKRKTKMAAIKKIWVTMTFLAYLCWGTVGTCEFMLQDMTYVNKCVLNRTVHNTTTHQDAGQGRRRQHTADNS